METLRNLLHQHGIDSSELLRESARLEEKTKRDRQLGNDRQSHRRAATGTSYAAAGIDKPRSGKPLRLHTVTRALDGNPVSPRQRAKIVRALNAALRRRGVAPVAAAQLRPTATQAPSPAADD